MLVRVVIGAVISVAILPCGWSQSSTSQQAMELFHRQQWTDAAAAFGELEKQEPGKTDALLYRGKALVNLGRMTEGADALQAYIKDHSKSDDALYLLAFIRFRENQPKESLELFTAAAKLKPPAADDLKIIALNYTLLNDYSSAARYLEECLKLDPESIEARYHLGRTRYQQNEFDLAIAAFREVLKRDPNNEKAEDNLGLSLEGKNDMDAAIQAYRRAIHLDQTSLIHSEQPYLNLGTLLCRSDETTDAVSLLEQSVHIAPEYVKAHRELGKCYFTLGRFDNARVEVEKAVQLASGDSSNHYLLGRIYRRLGKSEMASQEFQRTEELLRAAQAKSSGMGNSREMEQK
jgi:tetratricopeptide (TPR) repeat protein